MLSAIKEIGVFVVIAQAILYFVPGETYVKYVKVLIGVMMIAKMISPVFSLLSEDGVKEIALQTDAFMEELEEMQENAFLKEAEDITQMNGVYEKIYTEIGNRVADKLNQNPVEGYTVEQVKITQKGEEYDIFLWVKNTLENGTQNSYTENELEVYYGEILQTGNVKVQINR